METTQRTRIRRILGGIVAAALILAGGALVTGTPASAETEFTYPNAISDIQVERANGGDGEINQWELVRISATWSVPDDAVAGQTFGMTLPPEFARYGNGTFELVDPATGAVLATCRVEQGNGAEVICTLTDEVNDLENIGGSLWLTVQATKSTENGTVEFLVGDEYVTVELPGEGGIIPEDLTEIETPYKYGGPTAEAGKMRWTIAIPSSFAQDGSFTISDALDPSHESHHYTGELTLIRRLVENGQLVGAWETVDDSHYSVTFDSDYTSFEFEAHGLPNEPYHYRLVYLTEVDGIVVDGDIFGNSALVETTTTTTTYTYESAGGGDGTGDMYTRFTITKAVTGSQAGAAIDARFTVRYAVKGSGDPAKTMQVRVGVPERSDRAPIGSTFVIEEIDFPVLPGVNWSDWTLTGDGVVEVGDGTWEVRPETPAGVQLTLTNQADDVLGQVAWSKTDPAGQRLSGSEWELLAPDGTRIAVVDNGQRDADPEAGAIVVTDLTPGEYTLSEVKAPAGYQATDDTFTVTVDGEHLAVSFGDVVNVKTPPVSQDPGTPDESTPAGMALTGFGAGGIAVVAALLIVGGATLVAALERRHSGADTASENRMS